MRDHDVRGITRVNRSPVAAPARRRDIELTADIDERVAEDTDLFVGDVSSVPDERGSHVRNSAGASAVAAARTVAPATTADGGPLNARATLTGLPIAPTNSAPTAVIRTGQLIDTTGFATGTPRFGA